MSLRVGVFMFIPHSEIAGTLPAPIALVAVDDGALVDPGGLRLFSAVYWKRKIIGYSMVPTTIAAIIRPPALLVRVNVLRSIPMARKYGHEISIMSISTICIVSEYIARLA